jgi:HEAT repeats
MSPEPAVLAAGAVMLALAWAWRALARARTSRQLRRAARHQEPWVRRAAVEVIAEQGLHRFAELLVERANDEDDPAVVEALALAIVRNQWEPADSPRLVQLRIWAHLELQGRREAAAAPSVDDAEETGTATVHRLRASGGP